MGLESASASGAPPPPSAPRRRGGGGGGGGGGAFRAMNVLDYERAARALLPRDVDDYQSSGAEDEQALRANRTQFERLAVVPRMLRATERPDTAVRLLGSELRCPLFISPFGLHRLAHDRGERASAAAAHRNGMGFCLSQHGSTSVEELHEAVPDGVLWFQSYILRRRAITARLVERAAAAGFRGVFVTVDSPVFGHRFADARNGFNALPGDVTYSNYEHDPQLMEIFGGKEGIDDNIEVIFDGSIDWSDVRWLRSLTRLPLAVKGVLHPDDAVAAADAGASAVVLSNHGGRQLGCAAAPMDTIADVLSALRSHGHEKVEVYVDGGVRSGDDVLKVLAMGASAAGIARPVFWALAVDGEDGVLDMLSLLRRELERSLVLAGCRSIADARALRLVRTDVARL